jgi:transcriptional regulator with XRE-family HTH domain
MSKTKTKFPNSIHRYRERLGFTQDQLAYIIGCKHSRGIRRFESGGAMPGSLMMLRIAVALRVSVDYLYEETFKLLREEVRATEERMPKGQQGVLPLPI